MVKTKSVQKGGYWYWRPLHPDHFAAKTWDDNYVSM